MCVFGCSKAGRCSLVQAVLCASSFRLQAAVLGFTV